MTRRAGDLRAVARRAAHGDPHATAAITLGARAAGRAPGGLADALGPHRVVVAGGVPLIGALHQDALCAAFAGELVQPLRRLRPTAPRDGPDPAVLGAAAPTRTSPQRPPHTTGAQR
ncbi:ROK family protein [Streptomyces abyssomicinicus]|uniref:ROK family protein n=1 Tax=Streptomyces abyssomicinicus TaxID=574929 RepID=UPI003F7701C0